MARALQQLGVVLEDWRLPSPGQQLLDRFLIGYSREDQVRTPGCRVVAYAPPQVDRKGLDRRARDHGLQVTDDLAAAVTDADGVLVACREEGYQPNEDLLRSALKHMKGGRTCYVAGVVAKSRDDAVALQALAGANNIRLVSGSALNLTWRLPEISPRQLGSARDILVLVQGRPMQAEVDALECVYPYLERGTGRCPAVREVVALDPSNLWDAGRDGLWSWELLAAAVSRSNSPQGDPVRDARTQDLVGLGLVESLAKAPRGWIIHHRNGPRLTVLVLNGVVADYNVAIRSEDDRIHSAQVYRAPKPAQSEYDRLCDHLERLMTSDAPYIASNRSVHMGELLERFRQVQG